jgi:hypothetical protein
VELPEPKTPEDLAAHWLAMYQRELELNGCLRDQLQTFQWEVFYARKELARLRRLATRAGLKWKKPAAI